MARADGEAPQPHAPRRRARARTPAQPDRRTDAAGASRASAGTHRPTTDRATRQLRGALLDTLGTVAEDHEVVARAAEYRDRDTTDADVVAACISITAHHGNADLFDEYLDRFRTAATPQEQLRYLYSLAVFPSEELVLRAGELATTDAVRTQNAPFLVQRALTSREYGPLVWEFVRDHWDTIEARFPRTLIARMLEGITWLVDDASVRACPRTWPRIRSPKANASSPSTSNASASTAPSSNANTTASPPRSWAILRRQSANPDIPCQRRPVPWWDASGACFRGHGPLLRACPGLVRDELRRAHRGAGRRAGRRSRPATTR